MKIKATALVSALIIIFLMPLPLFSFASKSQAQNPTSLCTFLEQGEQIEQVAQMGRGSVNEIVISPDGANLAVAGSDGVWLYEAQSFLSLQVIRNQSSEPATSVSWSSDGKQLAITLYSGDTQLWNLQTKNITTILNSHARFVSWSPDGSIIATVDFTGTVVLWDATTGDLLQVYSLGAKSVAWSPDSKALAVGSIPKQGIGTDVYIWTIDTDQPPFLLGTSAGNAAESISLSWSPDGSSLAVGGAASTVVELWDVTQGTVIATLPSDLIVPTEVQWSPDGTLIAIGGIGNQGGLLLWDPIDERVQWLEEELQPITHLVWSPDGSRLFSFDSGGALKLWDAANGQELQAVDHYWGIATTLVWSPDGTQVAAAYFQESGTGSILIWDVVREEVIWTVEHLPSIFRLGWSPDGTQLAASSENLIQLWNIEGARQPILNIPAEGYVNIIWSPDTTQFASLPRVGEVIHIWDAITGETVQSFEKHGDIPDVRGIWTNEGLRWLTVDDTALHVWQANVEEPIFTVEMPLGGYFSFLFPSGSKLITSYQLWSIESNSILAPFYTSSMNAMASPDETCIASAISAHVPLGTTEFVAVGLWSIPLQAQVAVLPVGHGVYQVTALAWSPDGMSLATTAADGIIRIWGIPK